MSDTVISVEHLSKSYQLGVIGTGTFYGDLSRWWARQRGRPDPYLKIGDTDHGNRLGKTIWALKDINLSVQQGEAVGIIGRNGAGKSTLLKILSQVTAPTEGTVKVRGRIASLLEVGTGFHPELTGRENIFLNGAIMGMSRAEVIKKFDEIVDFSGVEQFIDTPVKRYSSGMYVRLAFAVAAHLEPEILIVDEVLAVGDAEFQKKCLGKMEDVTQSNRTVIFVSHNMQAIRNLCHRCMFLSAGSVILDDTPDRTIETYLLSMPTVTSTRTLEEILENLPPDPTFLLHRITLTQNDNPVVERVLNGYPLDVSIEYEVFEQTVGLRVFLDLCDTEGNILFRSFHDEQGSGIPVTYAGRYVSKTTIPENILAPIKYELIFYSGIYNVRMCIPDGIRIPIIVEATGNKNKAYVSDTHHGKLAPVLHWNTTLN